MPALFAALPPQTNYLIPSLSNAYMLLEIREAQKLLDRYKIPHPRTALCASRTEVIEAAYSMRFPMVLKASSRDESHKTEKGLVQLGIHGLDELSHAFARLELRSRGLKVDAFVLQEQARGVEFIVGGLRDPVFGPSVLFGLGGIYAELFNEVAVRVCPLKKKDAYDLLGQTRAKAFFAEGGFRGKRASREKAAGFLLGVSKLMQEEDVASLDLNPVMIDERRALAVDARVVMA